MQYVPRANDLGTYLGIVEELQYQNTDKSCLIPYLNCL